MIKVIIADDHRLVSESLRKILDSEQDIRCVGVAESGIQAIEMAKELQPDVAIIDINMPGLDGIEATQNIKTNFPKVAVLVLTAYDREEYVIDSLRAGANGFVLKTNLFCDELVNAVRTVYGGRGVLDHEAMNSLRRFAVAPTGIEAPEDAIGEREKEVLQLAARGMSSKQIASALNISELTVNSHFAHIFGKLGVRSRIEAVMAALRKGLISTVNTPRNSSRET